MQKDERDLLDVLKLELNFLEGGGYRRASRQPWRWQFIFEESPACFNCGCFDYDCRENSHHCTDCVLVQMVPPESRTEEKPCRQIPLNAAGETLDSLYRYRRGPEVGETVGKWLRTTIERLEQERHGDNRSSPPVAVRGTGV